DGRCRFPGCTIAARFCDLDHVRPWPTGPTTATNLLTLCRRHHRIKQRPGWRLHLTPDGTTTWTDPTGRIRTTAPLNALHSLVLRADPPPDSRPAEPVADIPRWSALETHLGLLLEHHPNQQRGHDPWNNPTHRRCTSATDLRAALSRRRACAVFPDLPPF
ncbi:MAG TPA: HNH endonuclease signature motif containing protein, partial [Nocardioides sp.]|nr:HNH endonuclease signature motif containing protein [Nocardioides sp.]